MSGKIVTLQDRTDNYVPIYPVTSPKAVIDSLTGETLEETNQQKDLAITGLQANKYVICNTASAIGAKIIVNPNFVLDTTAHLFAKFTYQNAAGNVTLNVNGTGAKTLLFNGSSVDAINTWLANDIVEIIYDGTNYKATSYDVNIVQILGQLTTKSISQKGITDILNFIVFPAINFIAETVEDGLHVTDADGNVIFKIDQDGIDFYNKNKYTDDAISAIQSNIESLIEQEVEARQLADATEVLNRNTAIQTAINSILQNIDETGFYITDADGNVIFKIDQTGVHYVNQATGSGSSSSELQTISDNGFYIVDSAGNVVVKIDNTGLHYANQVIFEQVSDTEYTINI